MANEEEVKQAITTWLVQFNCNVLWEKSNAYGHDIFHTTFNGTGTNEKPDLLIQYCGKNYLCEVKEASHKSNVYDSLFQLLGYASNEYSYTYNDQEIIPDGYLVATEHSLCGHLFHTEYEQLLDNTKFGDGRRNAILKNELPKNEYNMTEQYCRVLWRGALQYGIHQKIGILLSNTLNGGFPYPLFLYKQNKTQGYELWK